METHEVVSCINGFCVYGNNWTPSVGEILICERKSGNPSDSYAVTVKKEGAGACEYNNYIFLN